MSILEAVRVLVAGIPDEVSWAVTASANLSLRGLPVDPGDIDIATTKSGAYAIEAAFSNCVTNPVRQPEIGDADWIRSHYGQLQVSGVDVDIVGNAEIYREGSWVATEPVKTHREYVTVDNVRVPVMSLEFERNLYAFRGDDDRLAVVEGAL